MQRRQGTEKNEKVIESLLLDWWKISITNKLQIEALHIRGKELPKDQHSCTGSAGSQLVSLGGSGPHILADLSGARSPKIRSFGSFLSGN